MKAKCSALNRAILSIYFSLYSNFLFYGVKFFEYLETNIARNLKNNVGNDALFIVENQVVGYSGKLQLCVSGDRVIDMYMECVYHGEEMMVIC